MMEQYLDTKKQYPDCLLFYRIGDFYEMFFEDAKTGAEVLDLVLTGKECGMETRAPMCGIPYHAADSYIARLVNAGYKVAIGEQMEDPKLAKGLVRREVVRVITPGTITSEMVLDEKRNNFLMSVYYAQEGFGIAIADISTGEFLVTECRTISELTDELSRFQPSEIVCNPALYMSGLDTEQIRNRFQLIFTEEKDDAYREPEATKRLEKHFGANIQGLGLSDRPEARAAASAALYYIYETQKGSVDHISNIRFYSSSQYMVLDTATKRNLELTETMREKKKRGSLLWVLDKTRTAMGARLLRRYIEQPLISREQIIRRQDAVEDMNTHYIDREEISEYLSAIYDFERILGRICYKSANPRDLIAFKQSLSMLGPIKATLSSFSAEFLKEIREAIDPLSDLYKMIDEAIIEDPPVSSRDGGFIRAGYHPEADQYMEAKSNGKQWLAELEAEEREATGIKGLKIKYNRIFGYCIEVTNAARNLVPERYIRKQTLAGAERYTTEKLDQLQNMILGAEEKLHNLEYALFCDIRDTIADNISRVQETSHRIAELDTLISLSKIATQNHYVRPEINTEGRIVIRQGRHPVIEKLIDEGMFIANDTVLDNTDEQIAIITGPNMAGKSTYMRQTALIVLMAAIGSFVPAEQADIAVCDRIFTRVGASDDLASGQSTFMVEMNEVANILRNATQDSLLILDEIGRGTSTFDGLSIAWAVVEYIAEKVRAKTLFATHYHELTELEGRIPGVNNYCIAVANHDKDIVFLRKIIPGGADQSYGIDVASLAGVPEPVIARAKVIAGELNAADVLRIGREISAKNSCEDRQITLEDYEKTITPDYTDAVDYLKNLDLNHMTPLDAMNNLFVLKEKFGV